MNKVKEVLEERGATYGDFATIAKFTNQLQQTVRDFIPYEKEIPDHMQLAINMILHKIVRAVNGDTTYIDTWTDIAGYALLVADELAKAKIKPKRKYTTPHKNVPEPLKVMSKYKGSDNSNYVIGE